MPLHGDKWQKHVMCTVKPVLSRHSKINIGFHDQLSLNAVEHSVVHLIFIEIQNV